MKSKNDHPSKEKKSIGHDQGVPLQQRRCIVAGIGASAGALESFKKLLLHIPPDSGISYVLVQHLDPRQKTLMPELLAKHTTMPVILAADDIVVSPNHVYVVSSNTSLTIEEGVLRVTRPADARAARNSIDTFFRTLAEDQEECAVGIILSGNGTDGTEGIKAIKERGGMTMAQAAETTRYSGMPKHAIASGLVDHVLTIEEMPARLIEYARYVTEIEQTRDDAGIRDEAADQLARICAILRRQTGHDFSRYKRSTLVRRIQHRIQVQREESVSRYVDRLLGDPNEVDQLFKDLLIGVTQFFRDPEAFDSLREHVIPKLFENNNGNGYVRVWVPGCSTGEEAYSLAIILSEYIAEHDPALHAQIFATDIDDEALEIARQARYPLSIEEHISPERLDRFFTRQGDTYHVIKEIREMCIFSTHNLIKDPPFSRLDLISCRNMLIYLEHDIQKQIVPLFHYSLRPGGYLFLGPSESIAGHPELFRTVDKKHRIFQGKSAVIRPAINFPMMEQRRLTKQSGAAAQRMLGSKEPNVGQMLERLLLDDYAPASVIVNEQSDIVYFFGRTSKFLEQPSGAPSLNVINMARKGLRLDLRTALHKAAKRRVEVVHENVAVATTGGMQRINLIVRPLTELGEDSGLFMIVFQELVAGMTREETPSHGMQAGEDTLIQQLEHELRTTKEYLQATIEELETSNEELTSSNEELLSMNEEIQSANEELQTSKEELQSVNEELETINTELNKKVDELDRANSDLQNLFQSTQIATIFLDDDLTIKKFTPAATEVFRLIDSDIGRPITDIAPRFADRDLVEDIRDVLRTLATKERQVHHAEEHAWYIMRILPYRTIDNVIDGVVITFVDITATKQARLLAEKRAAQQAAVASLGIYALQESDLEAVFDRAVQLIHEILDTEFAEILELIPDEESLVLKGGRGWNDGYIGRAILGTGFDSQAGYTLASEEPVIVEDLNTETRFRRSQLLRDHGVVSGVSVIIYGQDGPYGALGAHSAERRSFSEDDVIFLQAVANVLGTATQRQTHLQALRQSEERHRMISDMISDYTFSYAIDSDGMIQQEWITESLVRTSGYTSMELADLSIRQRIVHPDDAEQVARFVEDVRGNKEGVIEFRLLTKDGAVRWVRNYVRPIWDEHEGRVVRLIGAGQDITERREAEEEIRRSRQELLDFVENATVGLHWVDANGYIIWANNAELEMLGYTREEYVGHHISEFHADRGTIGDILIRLGRNESLINYEARLRRKDGAIIYVLINSNVLRQDDTFIHTRCFTRDITERRNAEMALQANEERMRAIFSQVTVGIAQTDMTGTFVLVNDRFCEIVGRPREELLDMSFSEITYPQDRALSIEKFERLVHEGEDFVIEKRYLRPDGSIVWANNSVTLIRDSEGRPQFAVAVVLDVTGAKEADVERARLLARAQEARDQAEEARERTAFLAEAGTILSASLDYQVTLTNLTHLAVPRIADYCVIFEIDSNRSLQMVAYVHRDPERGSLVEQVGRLYGRKADLEGSSIANAIATATPLLVPEAVMTRAKQVLDREHDAELIGVLDELQPESMMVLPLIVRGEVIGLMILVMTDSGRIYDEQDLSLGMALAGRAAMAIDNAHLYREAQRANAAKDQFLAVLSHELRTPLTPALASVEALQEQSLTDEAKTFVDLIRRNIELEARLIDDLLDLTRIIKGKLRLDLDLTDAHALIQNVLDICRAEIGAKRLLLVVDLRADVHYVRGDSARLQQVFWNIVKNAIKFTPHGGAVTIISRNEGDDMVIEVSDTGVGIDEAMLPIIFNAFEQGEVAITRRYGGLGLGLAISKSLVEMHAGILTASSPGRNLGATFTIRIPFAQQQESPAGFNGNGTGSNGSHGRPIRVLVVDDYRESASVMRVLLDRKGVCIYAAYSPESALDVASSQDVDIVIGDFSLPGETGEADLLAKLLSRRPMKAITVSGVAAAATAPSDFTIHIMKPFSPHALHDAIDRLTE